MRPWQRERELRKMGGGVIRSVWVRYVAAVAVGGHPYDDAIRKGKRITAHDERDLRLTTGLESGTLCRGDICLRLGLGDDRCGMVAERGAAAGLALVRAIIHGSGEWHDVRGCARDMGTGECCMPGEHGGAGLACCEGVQAKACSAHAFEIRFAWFEL